MPDPFVVRLQFIPGNAGVHVLYQDDAHRRNYWERLPFVSDTCPECAMTTMRPRIFLRGTDDTRDHRTMWEGVYRARHLQNCALVLRRLRELLTEAHRNNVHIKPDYDNLSIIFTWDGTAVAG